MGNELRATARGKRGSGGKNGAPNASRLGKLKAQRGEFDLTRLDADMLFGALDAAIRGGGALRIGLTRDRGALAVGVYVDGASETVYLNAEDDQAEFWATIVSVYAGTP